MIFQEEREKEQLVHALNHLQLEIQLQKVVDQRLDNINQINKVLLTDYRNKLSL